MHYSPGLQIVMAKVDSFLDSLITYDKENIHPEVIKAIQPYLKDSEFDPEFVRTKSGAAAGGTFKNSLHYSQFLQSQNFVKWGNTSPHLYIFMFYLIMLSEVQTVGCNP